MTNEISSSESLDYHIIIPAGDCLSISEILRSITHISIFFPPEKGVDRRLSCLFCFFLLRFIQYQQGILHTHKKRGEAQKVLFDILFCVVCYFFFGPGGIDQLTSQRVASGRQHQGCICIHIQRTAPYKGGIDPF